jgi:hypothetical protein
MIEDLPLALSMDIGASGKVSAESAVIVKFEP